MGVVDTVKDVAFLIQKTDNVDLLRRAVELQQQVYALVDENRTLQDQVRVLKEKLATRDQMAFRKNAYWKADEGPYCPRCFDAESLVVRMLVTRGFNPECPKCHTIAADPDREPPKPVARYRKSSAWS
jgi:hypothetical protein